MRKRLKKKHRKREVARYEDQLSPKKIDIDKLLAIHLPVLEWISQSWTHIYAKETEEETKKT